MTSAVYATRHPYVGDMSTNALTVTSQEASRFAGHDIKECYDDIVLLQNLIKKTGLDDYAFRDIDANYMIAETAPIDEIHINVVNNAEDGYVISQ